jgi:hypothetical protein
MALTPEQKERYLKIVEALRPEAKEFTDQMMKDPIKTTKDNYGKVMAFISKLEEDKKGFGMLFLIAMQKEGYPAGTAGQIRQIMGWA